jgi:hypothetical protein
MPTAIIQLAYKQIIDASATGRFEQQVFNDSYSEFLMQVQAYNAGGKYTTFGELVTEVPRSASLHYKVGFAIGLYVTDLNNQIPELQDTPGRKNLMFATHKFEIIQSDTTNKSAHKVALTYITGTLTLINCIGDCMLLASDDQSKAIRQGPVETFLVKMQPNLSVISYMEVV